MRLQPKYATNDADAQGMRRVRNTCVSFLTRDRQLLTENEQRLWFRTLDRTKVWPFVFRLRGKAVGYGLIRREKRTLWLSGGLMPSCRGKGLGTELFGFLVGQALAIRARQAPVPDNACSRCNGYGWHESTDDHTRNMNCRCVHRGSIMLEVFETNTRAKSMYQRLGFRLTGSRVAGCVKMELKVG